MLRLCVTDGRIELLLAYKEMMHITLTIISKSVLGSNVKLEEDDEVGNALYV